MPVKVDRGCSPPAWSARRSCRRQVAIGRAAERVEQLRIIAAARDVRGLAEHRDLEALEAAAIFPGNDARAERALGVRRRSGIDDARLLAAREEHALAAVDPFVGVRDAEKRFEQAIAIRPARLEPDVRRATADAGIARAYAAFEARLHRAPGAERALDAQHPGREIRRCETDSSPPTPHRTRRRANRIDAPNVTACADRRAEPPRPRPSRSVPDSADSTGCPGNRRSAAAAARRRRARSACGRTPSRRATRRRRAAARARCASRADQPRRYSGGCCGRRARSHRPLRGARSSLRRAQEAEMHVDVERITFLECVGDLGVADRLGHHRRFACPRLPRARAATARRCTRAHTPGVSRRARSSSREAP